jgi:hypothetical protein
MLATQLARCTCSLRNLCRKPPSHTSYTERANHSMDQLQIDAAKSYEERKTSKRADSICPQGSDPSPSSDHAQLLEDKDITIQDATREWSETWTSAKTHLHGAGGWICEKSKKLYRDQRRGTSSNAPATYQHGSDHENQFLESNFEQQSPEYLMLGLNSESGTDRLIQVRLPGRIVTDTEFFRILEREYSRNRIRYYGIPNFLKYVESIHFVRFQTQEPGPDPDQHNIRIVDSHSLPDENEIGWTRLVMAERPPMPETMARYLKNPTMDGLRRSNWNYQQVPRKLESEIPAQFGITGWGLYYRECSRWLLIVTIITLLHIFVLVITLSTLFAS